MISRARAGSPEEVCGWLAGEGERARKAYPVPNVADQPAVRFIMDPEAQLAIMRRVREEGLEIMGTYHSHPRGPARPSARDRQLLTAYPEASHLIVSLAAPEPKARCYRIDGRRYAPLKLHIEQEVLRTSINVV